MGQSIYCEVIAKNGVGEGRARSNAVQLPGGGVSTSTTSTVVATSTAVTSSTSVTLTSTTSATSASAGVPTSSATTTGRAAGGGPEATRAGGRGGAVLLRSSLAARGRLVLAEVRCSGAEQCRGVIRLLARERGRRVGLKGRRHRRAARVASASGGGIVLVGSASYSIAASMTAEVRIKITPVGMKLLRTAGRKGLRVIVKGTGVRPGSAVLRAARQVRRRRRRRKG